MGPLHIGIVVIFFRFVYDLLAGNPESVSDTALFIHACRPVLGYQSTPGSALPSFPSGRHVSRIVGKVGAQSVGPVSPSDVQSRRTGSHLHDILR
jgi:hypothetical protein